MFMIELAISGLLGEIQGFKSIRNVFFSQYNHTNNVILFCLIVFACHFITFNDKATVSCERVSGHIRAH